MFRLVILLCCFLANFAALAHGQQRPQEKIVGGHDTNITEVPYQVSVQYNGSHVCGGSIIGAKHILTGAQCVQKKNPTPFSVRVGSNYKYKDGQEVKVADIISHPDYDADTEDYDAAILVLSEALTCSDEVGMAMLTKVEPNEGESVLVSGWGSLGKDKSMSDILQSETVTVVSRDECKKMYGSRSDITDRMFCAGYPKEEKNSCEGDKGGPAMVSGTLAGIVSGSDGCGIENVSGVYTNIAKIVDWILDQIED